MADSPLITEWLSQLAVKYGDRRKREFAAERSQVSEYLSALSQTLGASYTLEKPLAVGGTGIVFTGRHNRIAQPVVVKFNRPNVPPGELTMLEKELRVLPLLNHPNIIRVLDVGQLTTFSPSLTYLVEPFIVGSKPLFVFDAEGTADSWLRARIATLRAELPDAPDKLGINDSGKTTALVTSLLSDLTNLFSQWMSLLEHLHEMHSPDDFRFVYLDVKPENVIVDEHLHLTSIDYGSVEHLDSGDATPVEVFYTNRYAHPDLLRRMKEKASSNRVRASVKRQDLRVAFDYYALGVSLLEILNEVGTLRPHVVPQLPLYRSLHFLATRLLDALNTKRKTEDHYPLASQVFPTLRDNDYKHLRYEALADAERDLDKERGRWSLEQQIPELATYSKDIVRLVPGYNTVLTPRLRSVIEHPIVARLKYVTQLGLVSLVYPTADHSRYDHALGSYTYTTNYIKSLFNDLGNPIFRNLVGPEDLNAVLLAALLHDLGQYPLAHDFEEVHDEIFKHTRMGVDFLEDPMVDRHGRTLRELIEDPKHGWGVPADLLKQILGAHSRHAALLDGNAPDRSLKVHVLGAIIDGPVDADKADYIIRDSARCELPYGAQLDLERLLRVLTVAILPDETNALRRVTLGVYDKGLASAHAFGQARYQLLSTVYWHHTARIVKTMLQYATAIGLPREVFDTSGSSPHPRVLQVRQHLVDYLKRLVPPFDMSSHLDWPVESPVAAFDMTAAAPDVATRALGSGVDSTSSAAGAEAWYPGIAWTDWLMLRWIAALPAATSQSRALIMGIQTRCLYKRIATMPRGGDYDALIRELEALDWPRRRDLCVKLHNQICGKLRRDWDNLNTATPLNETEFDRLCKSQLLILIDVPQPSRKIGYDRPLGVVPELTSKSHQESRQAAEDRRWREIMAEMIAGIAPVRVLCHPEIRNLIEAKFVPVENALADEIRLALSNR